MAPSLCCHLPAALQQRQRRIVDAEEACALDTASATFPTIVACVAEGAERQEAEARSKDGTISKADEFKTVGDFA